MLADDSRFLRAARRQPVDAVPVWFMRQAGRSLPEYRRARGTGSILETIRRPEVVAELTRQPVDRHGVDAAILFSDIVVPVAAVGFGVDVAPGTGPVVPEPFAGRGDLARLRPLDPEVDTPYVLEAVRELAATLAVPLIGFAGAPFTVASYLVEGGPSRTYVKVKRLMHEDPGLFRELMEALCDLAVASVRSQLDAGCAAVQLFDSWAGALSPSDYERHVLPTSTRFFAEVRASHPHVPSIHFGVGTGELLASMARAGSDVMGVDWRVPLSAARERVGEHVALQGNLDPARCFGPWDRVAEAVDEVLAEAGTEAGHIFNLGHGVLPETDPDNLTAIVGHVHEHGRAGVTHQ